ncbi:MAG: MerR family transcriptional regulator [Lachnospiraceae bacterium]|nr:MerR family transcriptional regulator [Lachnospiraceae bacterium]
MKEYLTIGELANIFNMDVQILRHYDARGILVPAIRNETNGRRFYHFDQIYALASIRYLRKIGYSLDQIYAFVTINDTFKNLNFMTEQADALEQHCRELMATVDIIQKKLKFIREELPYTQNEAFQIRTYPERFFLHVGDELNLFTKEQFFFYPTIGFYERDRKWFGASLIDEETVEDICRKNPDIADSIPGGDYLCSYHYGPYHTIRDSIDRLRKEGKARGYQLENYVVTPNIVDQFTAGSNAKYITALEVRIIR